MSHPERGTVGYERALEANRLRKQRLRLAAGMKPRPGYARTKPWAALGMSRSNWYRIGKPMPPAVPIEPTAEPA